jgi:hypothetical protein
MAKRYFEDITDGEHLHCQKLVFTIGDIVEFAKRYDPQPFHTDENAAKESIFEDRIPEHDAASSPLIGDPGTVALRERHTARPPL